MRRGLRTNRPIPRMGQQRPEFLGKLLFVGKLLTGEGGTWRVPRAWLLVGLLSLTVIPLLTSCKDRSVGGTSLTQDNWSTEWMRAQCEMYLRCGEPFSATLGDLDTCVAYFEVSGLQDPYFEAVRQGSVQVDLEQLQVCIDTERSISCEELFASGPNNPLAMACESVLVGTQPAGTACRLGLECESGWCDIGDSCPGTCIDLPEVGQPCPHGVCAGWAECVAAVCQAPASPIPLGAACDPDGIACEVGAYCHPVDLTCQESAAQGEPCSVPQACRYGTFCSQAGVCERLAVGQQAGVPCNTDWMLEWGDCDLSQGLGCTEDYETGEGISCQPLRGLDEACLETDPSTGALVRYVCDPLADLYCALDTAGTPTGVCRRHTPLGDPCTTSAECGHLNQCDWEQQVCVAQECG